MVYFVSLTVRPPLAVLVGPTASLPPSLVTVRLYNCSANNR